MFETTVLRRIFGSSRKRRKPHNENPHDLYSLPNIVSDKIKYDEMGWEFSVHDRKTEMLTKL